MGGDAVAFHGRVISGSPRRVKERLEGGGHNDQGVNKEGEDWRQEKRAAMAAQAVEVRRRKTGMVVALVSARGREQVGSWAELHR
jgi:hypothetical protein